MIVERIEKLLPNLFELHIQNGRTLYTGKVDKTVACSAKEERLKRLRSDHAQEIKDVKSKADYIFPNLMRSEITPQVIEKKLRKTSEKHAKQLKRVEAFYDSLYSDNQSDS